VSETQSVRRLNFGCGYDKRDGYLNVDSDPECEPDILLLDNDLSVLSGEPFDEVLALDVLEHIPRTQTPTILLEWNDLLTPGGRLVLKTSSILGVAQQLGRERSFREQYGWTLCLFGTQAHPGDFHHTGFTELTLTVYLLAAGFRVDRMWITDRWLLNAEATKSSSWTAIVHDLADLPDEEFVRSAYREILDRDPDASELASLVADLAHGRCTRRAAVRDLMGSPEHVFVTAARQGFETEAKSSFSERALPYIPRGLRPPLRKMRTTAQSVTARGRRALGSLKSHEPAL
jgi:hypothetical protein